MSRKSHITQIHISFIDRDGNQTSERILTIDQKKMNRKLDHENWDGDTAVKRFLWYLGRNDQDGLDASYKALKRLGCFDKALRACLQGVSPNKKKAANLLLLWNNYGLHSLPRTLGDDLPIIVDAIKHFAPPHDGLDVTLYRGQSLSRYEQGVIGVAWTGRLEIAQQFARLRETPWVVLELDATPNMIAAHLPKFISTPKTNPASPGEYEDEYLIDPRPFLKRIRVHSKS